MDTSGFDSQARQHLGVYRRFLALMTIATIAVAIVLILMAVTLL